MDLKNWEIPENFVRFMITYLLLHYRARLAQSVERWTFNPTVVGSSPTSGVILILRV